MRDRPVLSLLLLAAVCLLLAAPPVAATVTFPFEQPLLLESIQSPTWGCLRGVPNDAEGPLVCWPSALEAAHTQTAQLQQQQLLRLLEGAVFVLDTGSAMRGDLAPLFNSSGGREDVLIPWIASHGAAAIVLVQTAATRGGTMEAIFDNLNFCEHIPILVAEIGMDDAPKLNQICAESAQQNFTLVARLSAGDLNEWNVFRRGPFMIAFKVVGTLLAASCIAVAGTKLVSFWRHDGIRLSTPQIILSLHLLSSVFRAIYISLDPIFAGTLMTGFEANMTVTISFPILPVCTLLLALMWHESQNKCRVRTTHFLSKMMIPFILISFLMVAGEIISTVLRAARIGRVGLGTTLIAILYACILSSFSLIFFVGGYRVLQQLRLVSTPQDDEIRESRGRLHKMTTFLIASGACNFVFILGFVLSAVESFAYSPLGFHVCWSVLYLGLLSGSLVQCLAVRMPDLDTHTSKGPISTPHGSEGSAHHPIGQRPSSVTAKNSDDNSSDDEDEDDNDGNRSQKVRMVPQNSVVEVDVSLEGTIQSEG